LTESDTGGGVGGVTGRRETLGDGLEEGGAPAEAGDVGETGASGS
jgi:hypothetical protein